MKAGVSEEYANVRNLICILLEEIDGGSDTPLLRELGYQLLRLVFPLLSEHNAEIHDQSEQLFCRVETFDPDEIPY